jgi:hypothetical protein
MNRPAINPIWPGINIAWLLLLCPPLPLDNPSADWIALGQLVAEHPHGYIDPYFESLLPPDPPTTVENAQSEYLLAVGSVYGSPALKAHCNQYLYDFTGKIRRRQFDSIIMEPGAFLSNAFFNLILKNYKITKVYQIRPYYMSFRDRLSFGLMTTDALFLTPRNLEKDHPATRLKAANAGHPQ